MTDHLHDKLDAAIDRVSTRMVTIDADRLSTQQIVERLPERPPRQWLLALRRQTISVAVALIVTVLGTSVVRHDRSTQPAETIVRHDRSTQPFDANVRPDRSRSPFETFVPVPNGRSGGSPGTIAASDRAEPPSGTGTTVSNARAERTRRTIVSNESFDKEYGLPPVTPPASLELRSIDVEADLIVAPVSVAPIVLDELSVLDDSSRD